MMVQQLVQLPRMAEDHFGDSDFLTPSACHGLWPLVSSFVSTTSFGLFFWFMVEENS
jgi:hypothetical protein